IPGMRVDVLITGPIPGSNGTDGPGVTTLLQNIQVLSAGTNFQKDREGKPEQVQVVNLLVTPSQAEILSLASNETRIQLVLRNPMDTAVAKTTGTRVSDLFGGAHATEPVSSGKPGNALPYRPPPPPPVTAVPAGPGLYVIDIANGAVHTQAKFSKPEGTQ
ncbi:MAG: Flp pilus assembly protein CpaB, partial [Acidobacteriota bacterium]|nr:Flp pilus assembly protein CpaB [Acidobacteriota bacterium]